MDEGVLVLEEVELCLGGEFSVDEEEGDLEEGGFFGKLLDGDSSVLEDSLVSVDVADA